ncbi:MAG: hypothetical protein ACLP1X_34445 [Polyangiaceae bacterium]
MSTHEHGIEQIRGLARHAERRIRLLRALDAGTKALCAALLAALVVVALRKLGLVGEGKARLVLALAGCGFAVAGIVAWAWRLPERAGARALDRFHGLHDRLASALAFADAKGRTPFMDAAIEDAIAVAPATRPRLAVRMAVPRALVPAVGLGCALAAVLVFETRLHVPALVAARIDPVEMAPDDLDDVKDFLKQLEQKSDSDDTRAAIQEFNKLVDDIANKRLDRTEAFRRMEALEEKLLTGSEADKKALEAELERVGDELKKSELTKPAGAALAEAKLDEARDALHDLARKLRERGGAVDKAKLDQMREALRRSSEDAQKRQVAIEQRRQELADEILKAKQRAGDGGSDEEASLLDKKKRELERLDRDVGQQASATRQLDRLDRELEQAAQDLMKDTGLSADDLDRGAEDLNRMDQGQMTDQQKEELRQKLQELRELVRQQGKDGARQVMRLKRFGRMARGQGTQGQQGGSQGNEGKDDPGQNGQGQGQGGDDTQGDNGHGGTSPGKDGQGGQGGETWVLGPNGERMLMLSRGQSSSGQGQSGSKGGEGGGQGGREWGVGHDPNPLGKATNPKMGTQDTQVQGAAAEGASRSQVILGAGERGFASRGYKKVYTEYHQVAEESLAKDEIPGGYLFYVKRYFQLIRPREH